MSVLAAVVGEKEEVHVLADGDGSMVQVAKIDFSKEGGGDSPLPGQVPHPFIADEAEPTFKKVSRGPVDEDQIQLQEENDLNYDYGSH